MHEVPVCTHELLLVSKFTFTVSSRRLFLILLLVFWGFFYLQVFFTLFTQYSINNLPCFRIELEVRKILTNSLLHLISFLPREM